MLHLPYICFSTKNWFFGEISKLGCEEVYIVKWVLGQEEVSKLSVVRIHRLVVCSLGDSWEFFTSGAHSTLGRV